MTPPLIPRALTIAGSDSGGGAGIQADLRTFAFHTVHGMSALTCVTAQNTLGVQAVQALTPDFVEQQVRSVVEDIGVDAVKTGMLLETAIINRVVGLAKKGLLPNLVVDPVMVSRTGAQLISDEAVSALRDKLIPLAYLVTPNRHEAAILAAMPIASLDDMQEAAVRIAALGCLAVLVKGGGMGDPLRSTDVFFKDGDLQILRAETVTTQHTHGTGCTLSAAITARLARSETLATAIAGAKHYVTEALHHSLVIGRGQGPVGHFYPLLKP